MPDWTDLNAWMAACWKGSWKVDPLAFSVPLRLLDEPPPEEVLDELQAASDKAIAVRAAPAITALRLRTRCIFNIPSQLPAELSRRMALMRRTGSFGCLAQTMLAVGDLSGASGGLPAQTAIFHNR